MGAKGLMQIIPRFHLAKLEPHGGDEAVLDPESNIVVGARILQEYVYRTGTLEAGLQQYNGASRDESRYAQVMASRGWSGAARTHARLGRHVKLSRAALRQPAAATEAASRLGSERRDPPPDRRLPRDDAPAPSRSPRPGAAGVRHAERFLEVVRMATARSTGRRRRVPRPWSLRRRGAAGAVTDRAGGVWLAYYAMQRQTTAAGAQRLPPGAAGENISAAPAVERRRVSTVWRGALSAGRDLGRRGVNFALFSKHAERVELCLFEPKGRRELERIELRERSDFIWHCYLPRGAARAALRLPRARAARRRSAAIASIATQLLLDPYARADPRQRSRRAAWAAARSSTAPSAGATTGRRARRCATR